ncbi:hypothetical protein PO909_024675, partial [Leuciscus waleckii]
RVTLTCVIQGGGDIQWRYSWFKDRDYPHTTPTAEFSFTADVYRSGEYSCRGERSDSHTVFSDAVTLTVSGKPVVKVKPDQRVFRGERVTLTCDIQGGGDIQWRYRWIRDGNTVYPFTTSAEFSFTADRVSVSEYSCRGERSYSHTDSDAVTLTVSDLKSKPELTPDPAGAALTGNTVTLTCRMDPSTGNWDSYWYKHTLNPETEKKKTNSYSLKIDSVSDGGQYWCRAGRGKPVYYTQYSDALWVNVTDGEVILESSVDPVIEGETLTLHCLHRSTNSPILSADFYKDGSLIQNQTTGEMNITTVSKSHEGFYYCKTERGQSLHSWISVRVRGQISVLKILSFLLAASPHLLATVVLLYKCYRARVSSAEDQSQYAVTEEETSI